MIIYLIIFYLLGIIVNLYLVSNLINQNILDKVHYIDIIFSLLSLPILLLIFAWKKDYGE